jgi:hypothetical protein
MVKYLISFNDGDMNFEPHELPQIAEDAHAVMREAITAGVWVFGGGFEGFYPWTVKADGTVVDGPLAESPVVLGGFTVLDVPTDEDANYWAARIGASCRCSQEVRKFMEDPEQDELLRS